MATDLSTPPTTATPAQPTTATPPGPTAADFATLDDLYDAALASLTPAARDFLEGGAGEERTLRANREAFWHWQFVPRVLSGIPRPRTDTTFLGHPMGLPVLTAPFGVDGLFHPDGHLAVARANAELGAISIVPELGTYSIEEVAAAAPGTPKIAQLHPMGERENVLAFVRRAERAGYAGFCLTCDCPTAGWRERNMHNHFNPELGLVCGNYRPQDGVDPMAVFGSMFGVPERIWSWDDVAWVFDQTELPFIAKGILTPADALAAVQAGASAILVSNHGGRQLDGTPAALRVLPGIADAVGDRAQILLDSGIRRGADVVTALALGADAVVIGRAAAMGLAAGGQAGVARVLELIRDEMITIMALAGRPDIASLDRTLLTEVDR